MQQEDMMQDESIEKFESSNFEQDFQSLIDLEAQEKQLKKQKDRSTLFIVLSIIELFLCGGIFALVPLCLSITYKSEVENDPKTPLRKYAKVSLVIVFFLGIASFIYSIGILASHLTL